MRYLSTITSLLAISFSTSTITNPVVNSSLSNRNITPVLISARIPAPAIIPTPGILPTPAPLPTLAPIPIQAQGVTTTLSAILDIFAAVRETLNNILITTNTTQIRSLANQAKVAVDQEHSLVQSLYPVIRSAESAGYVADSGGQLTDIENQITQTLDGITSSLVDIITNPSIGNLQALVYSIQAHLTGMLLPIIIQVGSVALAAVGGGLSLSNPTGTSVNKTGQ